jgi:sporulation protein YlmC with PRC-barrel domain
VGEATQFTIGEEVRGTDGVCGKVTRVVVDPVARAVTHIVVEPRHGRSIDRLVPLDLVEATTDEIRLRATVAEFEKLGPAEETQFLPGGGVYGDYRSEQAYFWPYYGLGPNSNLGIGGAVGMGLGNVPQIITYDAVPLGEVDVRRGEQVHATDGDIGRVQGLVIDPRDHHVTHVLLQEGHLWGRKDVAIPISAVTRVDSGIQLNITKQEVQDLPAVDIDHPVG